MYPIVDIVASPPAMNTHSKKVHLPDDHPVNNYFENGMAILHTRYFFFTLPNSLDDDHYIHLLQQSTCLYDIQDLDPEDIAEWKRKNWARKQKMQRIRAVAEKLVWLKRELRLMHKRSRTESGELGIVWWNQEYWDSGMGLKRLRRLDNGLQIKKEEPMTPSLHVKIESPPTPSHHYFPSSMSSSRFCSIDPNMYVWSP